MKIKVCFDTEKMHILDARKLKEFEKENSPVTAFLRLLLLHLKADGSSGLDSMGFCGAKEEK